MNMPSDSDQQFHENLQALGSRIGAPAGASAAARSRSAAQLAGSAGSAPTKVFRFAGRPAFLSTVGVAAALALVFGFLYQPAGVPTVNAATVLTKLSEQIQESPLIEVEIESIVLEGASVDGNLQVSEVGIAGDIRVEVTEQPGTQPVEVDLSLGLSEEDCWVLIRKLKVPDPEAAAVLAFLMPEGTETLVKLPASEVDFDPDFGVADLKDEGISQIVQELIDSASELGATVTNQPDGTVLLTLTIEDASTIESLARLKSLSGADSIELGGSLHSEDNDESVEPMKPEDSGFNIVLDAEDGEAADSDLRGLYGITLQIVYDPQEELIRSFVVENVGEAGGRVSIHIGEGEFDPALLDANRVTSENTRVLDLGAMQKMFQAFEGAEQEDDEEDGEV
jgi:hypothetical protein